MSADIEQMYREMVARTPRYERARKVIVAHIETIEKGGGLFTWAPVVDGEPGYLAPATEQRCCKAVAKELKRCLKEIDDHLKRVQQLG